MDAGLPVDFGPCLYLPDRRFFARVQPTGPTVRYRALLDRNHRRMGELAYRPACGACTACRQLRIPAADFRPSRSQRRVLRRNTDLHIDVAPCSQDAEHEALLDRYQRHVHDDHDTEGLAALLSSGSLDTCELRAHDGDGRLLAVSIVDCFPDALSSVYCYYDPDQIRRSLGTWMVLAELDRCRAAGLDWLYLGYHVAGCRKMAYKAAFRPCEIRQPDGRWERLPPRDRSASGSTAEDAAPTG